MGQRVGAVARGLLGGDAGADDGVVLGVDSGQAAGLCDRGERAQQLGVGNPRKPLWVGLEGGELERRGARVDEIPDLVDRASRRTSSTFAWKAVSESTGPAAS